VIFTCDNVTLHELETFIIVALNRVMGSTTPIDFYLIKKSSLHLSGIRFLAFHTLSIYTHTKKLGLIRLFWRYNIFYTWSSGSIWPHIKM